VTTAGLCLEAMRSLPESTVSKPLTAPCARRSKGETLLEVLRDFTVHADIVLSAYLFDIEFSMSAIDIEFSMSAIDVEFSMSVIDIELSMCTGDLACRYCVVGIFD